MNDTVAAPIEAPQPPEPQQKPLAPTPPKEGFWSRVDGFLGGWINGWNPYRPDKLHGKGLKPVDVAESAIKKTAAFWFLALFVVFMVWAFWAPIDAGVTSSGTVMVSGNRKQVQHPTGGVVTDIFVKEGSEVTEGQVLLKINPLQTEAEMTGAELQYINLLTTESRLRSERDGLGSIRWVDELDRRFGPKDTRVIEAKGLQVQLFNSRRAEFNSMVASLNEQINGLNAVLKSRQISIKTLDEEMNNTRALAKDGFVPQNQANQAERTKSDIEGQISSTLAEVSRAKLQISQLRTTFLKDVDNILQDVQKNRDPLLTRLDAAKFNRELAEVRAPVSGSIVALKVFTVGGVIQSGQVLLEVVPKEQGLIVQVKVPATIIDKVTVGMPTDMRFTAFNQITTPVIPGRVKTLGADKEPSNNPQEGDFYFGQVETTPEGVEMLGDLKVQPGMPVDVVFKSGERSFMSYLLKPLSDKAAMAFKN